MGKIQGVIFDMDGTLVDSEPIWREAEIEIFAREGLHLTEDDCLRTQGLQPLDSVLYWYRQMPKTKLKAEDIAINWSTRVAELFTQKGTIKPGVLEVLQFITEREIPMAVGSSSPSRFIDAVVDKLDIRKHFKVIYSGDFERYGKPHPGIYISTAKRLKAEPEFCVAFEDSFNGMIAAKAARTKLVAYLDDGRINDTKYDFADLKLESFYNFGPAELELLESLI